MLVRLWQSGYYFLVVFPEEGGGEGGAKCKCPEDVEKIGRRRSIPTHVTFAIRPVAPTAVSRLAFRSYYEVNQGNKAL